MTIKAVGARSGSTSWPARAGYRGEISGWAEAGPNRIEFFLKDKQGGSGIALNDPLSAEAVVEFLKKAEMDWIHAQIRQTCHEKAGATNRLHQKVRREMKRKVSEAPDGLSRPAAASICACC